MQEKGEEVKKKGRMERKGGYVDGVNMRERQ